MRDSIKKITIIVGLPGSGKSFLGKSLNIPFIDDISLLGIDVLKEYIKEYNHVAISDVFLCRAEDREVFKNIFKNYKLEWIFFENAPDKCLKNVIFRNDGRKVKNLIKQLSKVYKIPDDVNDVREVVNND